MTQVLMAAALLADNAPYLIGILVPVVVEWLNKDVQSSQERFLVSLLVCFLASLGLKWHELLYGSPDQFLTSLGLIFSESQVMFNIYFKDSWIRWKIQGGQAVSVGAQAVG